LNDTTTFTSYQPTSLHVLSILLWCTTLSLSSSTVILTQDY